VRARAEALAHEVGLDPDSFDRPVAALAPAGLIRVRLARALALDPAILLFEHPTAQLPRADVVPFAALAAQIGITRRVAILALTADREFADAVAPRVLGVDPATGRLTDRRGLLSRLWRA
jgi:ATPase subunit of ABC transporter with duplicated ATPase domains